MKTIIEKCDIHVCIDGNYIFPTCEVVEIEFTDGKIEGIKLYLDKRVELSTALNLANKCRMTYRANSHSLYSCNKNIDIREVVCHPM